MELPGSKLPNGWGLFDVHGNVYEWCYDIYGLYGDETVLTNPLGPDVGTSRVLRGGSFGTSLARGSRSAYRGVSEPNKPHSYVGFRVARTSR